MSITVTGRRGLVLTHSDFETLNTQELLFDAVHYAMTSTKYNSAAKTTNGDSVGVIKDKIGTADLIYSGLATPAVGLATLGTPTIVPYGPYLIDDKFMAADNRPGTSFTTESFTAIPAPYEVWLISRRLPGQPFEAKLQGAPCSEYLGDTGSGIRCIFNNVDIPGAAWQPAYELICERMVITGTYVSYYVNGTLVGTNSDLTAGGANGSSDVIGNTTKTAHSLIPYTNSADFDFGAKYFKIGIFSDATAAAIYASLATKWNLGSTPNKPLLTNMRWVKSGTSYTPEIAVLHTPPGVTLAAQSTWDYQWFWKDLQTNYDTQTQFSTSYVVNAGDFPANDGSHTDVCIKFRVRAKDTSGNTWRYLSGLFELYTAGASQYSV